MNHLKTQLLLSVVLVCLVGFTTSCGKGGEPPVTPSDKPVILTQLNVSLSEPAAATTTRGANSEEANVMKASFMGGDFFKLTYNAPKDEGMQVTYAHTTDGTSWMFRNTVDASSAVQTVRIDSENTGLTATYIPLSAAEAVDGIVAGANNTVICYDALQASGNAVISGKSASASLHFTHINHLLRFGIDGDASPADVSHLLLTLTYTDNAGKPITATLNTALHTEYTPASGNKQSVIQAIVPRDAVLKGVSAVFSSGKVLIVTDKDNLPTNLTCPGGKSRLIALHLNDEQLTMLPGDISDGWADGGTINSDGQLAGDIYINSAADLKAFRDAVNSHPESAAAKINGIRAYMANIVQTANIDLGGESWIPIGGAVYTDDYDVTTFKGTYNGNGYTISNFSITAPTNNGAAHYGGLFGKVTSPGDRSAVLVGIHLRNVSVNIDVTIDQYYVVLFAGTLVGAIDGNTTNPAVVSLCSVNGSVNAGSKAGVVNAGGLIGNALNTHINRCTVNASSTATGNNSTSVGGVVGSMDNSLIVSCYAQGAVNITQNTNTTANAGGIVGSVNNESSLVMTCRADGDVNASGADVNAGGLVGAGIGTFAASFAKGTVTGNANGTGYIGAIIGNNFSPSKLVLCYGTSAEGVGTSRNAEAKPNNIVYNATPSAGEILSVIEGRTWADANGGIQKDEAVRGGILTPVSLFASGQYSTNIQPRLWVLVDLFGEETPWSATSQGSTDKYPVPVMSYVGQ